jgi:hypothetical protein
MPKIRKMPKRSFDRKKNRKRADGVAEIGPVRSVPEHPTKPVNETIEIDKWLKLVERLLGERNTADLSVKYKAELEEILTLEVCKQQQGISRVSVSADGQFAIYNVAACYTVRRLSPAATEFLNHGDVKRLGELRLFL